LRPPCEFIVRHLLPAFRVLIAKELIEKYNLSQVAVAQKLGTTQAAISQYLSSKRGNKLTKQMESNPEIWSMVKRMAEDLANAQATDADSMLSLCSLCMVLREKKLISNLENDFSHRRERKQV